MHIPLETVTETVGFDEQTWSLYSLDAFKDREKGTLLYNLYSYWSTLPTGEHGLPPMDLFRPKEILPDRLAKQVSCIDTSANDPLDFVILEHAPSTIPGFGEELAGRPLCDRPDTDMDTTASAVEFLFCKHERTPMYHEVEQILGGLKRHFTRIMLPVENRAGDVERIYFVMRELQPVKRITFHVVGDG